MIWGLIVWTFTVRTIVTSITFWLTLMTGLTVPAEARSLGKTLGYVTRTWEPKTVSSSGASPITVDYETGEISSDGISTPIHVDGATWDEVRSSVQGTQTYVHFLYSRFDAFIDSAYYATREVALQNYLDKLHVRHIALESVTGWNSETRYGAKLDVYIYNGGSSCATGWALPAEAHIGLTNWFPDSSVCIIPYYLDGVPLMNNPGELGDQWVYWVTGIHEIVHSVDPFPWWESSWWKEGIANYFGYNVLALPAFGDINQETVDLSIRDAILSYTSFQQYTQNDYRDYMNSELQQSSGYDITAWMISMMRDLHGLDLGLFLQVIESNPETLARATILDPDVWPYVSFHTDSYIIDALGRASGLDFAQVQAIWRYDGPSGPGWGVRRWEDRDWYGDLTPRIGWSCSGDSLAISVWAINQGGTNLNDAEVSITLNGTLQRADTLPIAANDSTEFRLKLLSSPGPPVTVIASLDGSDHKIESDESNNADTVVIASDACVCICSCHADPSCDGIRSDISDVVSTINVAFRGLPPTADPYCSPERTDVDCDGSTNVVDVIKTIDVAFRGADAGTKYCQPCAP